MKLVLLFHKDEASSASDLAYIVDGKFLECRLTPQPF